MNLFVIISILAAFSVDETFSQRFFKKKDKECRHKDGSTYRGFVDKSSSGLKCLNWSRIKYGWGAGRGLGNHNYCRNPDKNFKPWCYVQKEWRIVKQFCNIPKCSVPAVKPTVKTTVKPTVKPTTTTPPPVDTEQTCGERFQRRMNKIVGGSFIPIESHPWIAAIFHKRQKFLCGGSLISPCWVLTAAHCFPDGEATKLRHLSVYLGKSAINDTDPEREQNFTVEKLIIHQKYNASNYNNDIALIKVRNTNGGCAVKTESVRTVCLPPSHTRLPPGITCNIAGFGKERYDSWHYSQLLKQAEVTLITNTECKREESYQKLITENMFCAASPDWSTDACKGDSGGPLVCEAAGRMFLFGVVSWGEGCASENKPGVYTQVTQYNKWVAAKTGLSHYTKGIMYPEK